MAVALKLSLPFDDRLSQRAARFRETDHSLLRFIQSRVPLTNEGRVASHRKLIVKGLPPPMSPSLDRPNVFDFFTAMSTIGLSELLPRPGDAFDGTWTHQPPILIEPVDRLDIPSDTAGRNRCWIGRPNAFVGRPSKGTSKRLSDGDGTFQRSENVERILEEMCKQVFGWQRLEKHWDRSREKIHRIIHDFFRDFWEPPRYAGGEPAVIGLVQAHEYFWSQEGLVHYNADGSLNILARRPPPQHSIGNEVVRLGTAEQHEVRHESLHPHVHYDRLFDAEFGPLLQTLKWEGIPKIKRRREDLVKMAYVYRGFGSEGQRLGPNIFHAIHPRIPDSELQIGGDNPTLLAGLTLPLVSTDRILDLYELSSADGDSRRHQALICRATKPPVEMKLVKKAVAILHPVLRVGRVHLGRQIGTGTEWHGIEEVLSFTFTDEAEIVMVSLHQHDFEALPLHDAVWKRWLRSQKALWQ